MIYLNGLYLSLSVAKRDAASAVVKSPLAGDAVTEQCAQFLADSKVDVVPAYRVGGKVSKSSPLYVSCDRSCFYGQEVVSQGEKPKWVQRKMPDGLTTSYQQYMVKVRLF